MNAGWLARIVVAAWARKLAVLVLLAVLGYVGMGRAEAGTCDGSGQESGSCDTREIAYSSCMARGAVNHANDLGHRCVTAGNPASEYRLEYLSSYWNDGYWRQGSGRWQWTSTCPSGQTWQEGSKTCFDPAECLARNADLGANGGQPRPSLVLGVCRAGCWFAMPANDHTVSTSSISGSPTPVTIYRGVMEYTPDACPVEGPVDPEWTPEVDQEPIEQECQQLGTQTACMQPDGQICHSAAHLRHICWQPGEVGEKTDQDIKQKKNPGPDEVPPNLILDSGDTLTKTGESVTTTTTTNNNTTTTTTTNYVTTHGTNAGPTNQGKPAGTTSGSEGGEEGGEENGVTGGADCDPANKPVPTGDALLGGILVQSWEGRCLGTVTVTGDVGNCSEAFTVTGPAKSAEVLKLKAMRASICPGVPSEEITDGTTGETAADGEIFQEGESTSTWLGKLDSSGFLGGSSCPAIPVFNLGSFGTYTPDVPYWCDLIAMLAAFVLFGASIAAIVIIME